MGGFGTEGKGCKRVHDNIDPKELDDGERGRIPQNGSEER
jgi:hypothetical protein